MPEYQSDAAALGRFAPTGVAAVGAEVTVPFQVTQVATLVATDKIVLAHLPKGARVTDLRVSISRTLGANVTFSVGDRGLGMPANSGVIASARYTGTGAGTGGDGTTVTATGIALSTVAAGANLPSNGPPLPVGPYLADDDLIMTIAGASIGAPGSNVGPHVKGFVKYVVGQ